MKNIFKSLMLVAVAAMAFTACQKDIDETTQKNDEKATTIHVTATIANDDTRSGFGDKVGTAYPSHWDGGETVKAYAVEHGGYTAYYNVYQSNTTTTAAEAGSTKAVFELSFDNNLSKGTIYILSAADGSVIDFQSSGYNYDGGQKPDITIPSEQTPDTDGKSVDPKAHILIYTQEYDSAAQLNGLTASFGHYAAYGKLSLVNFAGTGITQYVLTINDKKYVINSHRTTDVWFACEPTEVTNMSVSVVAEGTYTKTLDFSTNNLSFVKGRVSTFTVDMDGIGTGAAVDTFNPTVRFENITWKTSSSKDYLYLSGGTSSGDTQLILHANARPNNKSIKVGSYTYDGYSSIYESPSNENMFRLRKLNGNFMSYSTGVTLDVSFENNEYIIIIGYNGSTYGYKGMPEGWNEPTGSVGGNEVGGDVVTVTGVASAGNSGKNYTFNCTPQLTISFAMTNYMSTGTYELRAGYSGDSNVCNVMDIGGSTPTSVSGSISYTWSSPNAIITFNDVVIDGITFKGENITYSLM